ncbi:MAG: helix-turn-helix domain-containing protein [Bradyrhizobiaceae bacterium]|nr:helix-turn-helix domain-containing protein [Hyphomicrobiales bacterium]MBV9427035.1 helix-turn-helix domain-containing protein [Bradyrhizobiaceae bacterium]
MFSDSAVANDILPDPSNVSAARAAPAAFYSSGRYTHIRKRFDLAPAAAHTAIRSTLPEMRVTADCQEQSLYRLLLDEVESVNRLYRLVCEAGCDILFYDENGELAGRYGKAQSDEVRSAKVGQRTRASALASPIFNAEGRVVGSLDLASANGACGGPAAALMQKLLRSTAHAIEERAFRKRYAREWIVALAPPDGTEFGLLLAIDGHHRVVGADRRARTTLLQTAANTPAIAFWLLFEKNPTIFRHSQGEDKPVALTIPGSGEPWPALVTPPASERSPTPAQLDLHARPRLDAVGCFPVRPDAAVARGGLAPGALRRVREYIDGRLTESISLDALAAVAELSRCHFARAFKQSVGTSPHAYVMQRRLDRAERLLAETDLSLCQVALDSGFSDQSHFSSCFRKSFGESPRSFRRARR